ncbi:MAG: 50S ribosomal protein L1 [Chloroflexota bacterium]|nr:50S ribosomal protein L1 [Chloroflexota bacterium]MDE2970145.1 50S ribosomal protein L1 [Chloroflexota bacterium]
MSTEAVTRSHGKRHDDSIKKREHLHPYPPAEAVRILKEMAPAKFDETVELHIKTNADPRHADQLIRSVTQLPHGTGKSQRVVAFVQGEAETIAREAGADFIGDADLIRKIEQEGWVDFEVSIATPEMMGQIGRLGRVLGRRGLMPNPRTGTVVQPQDIPRAIREAKGGRVEFRMDRSANLHMPIGKLSFNEEQLLQNLAAAVLAVTEARPEAVKGNLFKTIHLTSTMGPSLRVNVQEAQALRVE